MAPPITWQNVQGPDSSSGFRAIEAAGRSINAAFDQFGGLIKDAQAVDAANWEQVKKNNTQDFLNKLYSATGPEQFKALQDSGQLQEMIAKNGAQIDQAAARSAMDGRLATLQQRETQGMAFKNAVANQANIDLDRKEEPTTYQIKSLLSTGDPASMAKARQLTAGLSARGQSIMLGSLDARTQELVQRDRGNKEWNWKGEKHAAELADMAERQKIARGQLAVSQTNAATAKGQLAVAQAGERRNNLSTIANLQIAANEALSKTNSNDPRTTQGAKAIFESLTQRIKDPDELADVSTLVSKAMQDPNYSSLSAGDLIVAATSLKNVSSWWRGDSLGSFKAILDKMAAQPDAGNWREREETARKGTVQQIHDLDKANEETLRAFLTGVGGGKGIGGGPAGARPAPQPANPVDASIPAPVPQPAPAPGAPKPDRFAAAMRDLAKLEQQEIQADVRNDFSPEVKAFFEGEKKSSTKADRAAIKNVVRQLGVGTANMANAAADLFTMPVRGVVAGVNQIPRLARASGLDVPDIPFFGTDSLTPYSDLKERQRAGQWTPAELAQKRKLLEEELKKAR
jgi:hypothetical protein